MKELSIEEKARAYDEAIDKVAYFIKKHIGFGCMIHPNSSEAKELFNIFPELKENKREWIEKIRQELKSYLEHREIKQISESDACHQWITWLEKQGEQKTATIDIDKMVSDYANNKERGNEEFGKPVNCMIRAYRQGLTDAMGKVVLRPAWSEEDGNLLKTTIDSLNAYAEKAHPCLKSVVKDEIDWLKSIKARNTWKPSDEQI